MNQRGFTLLELLVVVGLIATTSILLLKGASGGGRAAHLGSAQTTLANLVTATRTKAAATGRKTRLLVNVDPGDSRRYLRFVVLQVGQQAGASPTDWITTQSAFLPAGTYVVPATLVGLVADTTNWKRISDPADELVSDLFANQSLAYLFPGDTAPQLWTGVAFTPNGTMAALAGGPPPKGSIVVAAGRSRAGSEVSGQPGVELDDASLVRGLFLSAYGIPALLHGREAF